MTCPCACLRTEIEKQTENSLPRPSSCWVTEGCTNMGLYYSLLPTVLGTKGHFRERSLAYVHLPRKRSPQALHSQKHPLPIFLLTDLCLYVQKSIQLLLKLGN